MITQQVKPLWHPDRLQKLWACPLRFNWFLCTREITNLIVLLCFKSIFLHFCAKPRDCVLGRCHTLCTGPERLLCRHRHSTKVPVVALLTCCSHFAFYVDMALLLGSKVFKGQRGYVFMGPLPAGCAQAGVPELTRTYNMDNGIEQWKMVTKTMEIRPNLQQNVIINQIRRK